MAVNKMTLDQYAKHRNVSTMAISLAVKRGRFASGGVYEVYEGKQKRLFFDPILCDAQWHSNAKRASSVKLGGNPTPIPRGKPSKEHGEAIRLLKNLEREKEAELKAQKQASKAGNFVSEQTHTETTEKRPRGRPAGSAGKPVRPAKEKSRTESELVDREGLTIAQRKMLADTLKAEAQAEREQIALRRDKLELVEAEVFEDQFSGMIAKARDLFLHLPKSFRVTFQEAPAEYAIWLDERINSVLKELSGVGGPVESVDNLQPQTDNLLDEIEIQEQDDQPSQEPTNEPI